MAKGKKKAPKKKATKGTSGGTGKWIELPSEVVARLLAGARRGARRRMEIAGEWNEIAAIRAMALSVRSIRIDGCAARVSLRYSPLYGSDAKVMLRSATTGVRLDSPVDYGQIAEWIAGEIARPLYYVRYPMLMRTAPDTLSGECRLRRPGVPGLHLYPVRVDAPRTSRGDLDRRVREALHDLAVGLCARSVGVTLDHAERLARDIEAEPARIYMAISFADRVLHAIDCAGAPPRNWPLDLREEAVRATVERFGDGARVACDDPHNVDDENPLTIGKG